jgi:hypothetical protein
VKDLQRRADRLRAYVRGEEGCAVADTPSPLGPSEVADAITPTTSEQVTSDQAAQPADACPAASALLAVLLAVLPFIADFTAACNFYCNYWCPTNCWRIQVPH